MILGVDFGDSRTGFATSDALGFSAHTLETYSEKNARKVAEYTAALAKKLNAEKIVLGYPKNMNGTVGERGKKTKAFAKLLGELTGLEVILWDERLTTVSAHNLMNATNTRGKKRKDSVDKIAAAFILQAYLDSTKI
ncbi:MAG: Holliday junction resolvase RuvX [Clostridia bacterium]|nr:Holliday junction resolvase RuvX [Clostridia bacterium]